MKYCQGLLPATRDAEQTRGGETIAGVGRSVIPPGMRERRGNVPCRTLGVADRVG